MKTTNFYAAAILAAMAMVFVSCSKDEIEPPNPTSSNGDSEVLSNYEKTGLVALLETQKMHRDIYIWINTQVPGNIFTQLAESDGNLMDQLADKVHQYGITNPIQNKLPGEFEDVAVQIQYNEFIRLTAGDLQAMIENAKVMEEEMICAARHHQLNLSGNDDIRQIYGILIQQSTAQMNTLYDEIKGLVHVSVPQNEIRDH
jgi:hypothetical protein